MTRANLSDETTPSGYRPQGISGRARSTGLVITILLHLLVLALLILQPRLRDAPLPAETAVVSLLALASAPASRLAAQPPLHEASPRQARPTIPVLTPSTAAPESPIESLTEPDPAVAIPAPPAIESAATTAMAASSGMKGSQRPDCVPIPYGWLNQVARIIGSAQQYPAQSRQLGERGTVYVRLSMNRGGVVLDAPLLRSSGSPRLDQEATDVMRRIRNFGKVPDSACPGQRIIVIDQPVSFEAR
ncbi:MAG: energy transducer TonB family protein [Panacagrimonas sp.]